MLSHYQALASGICDPGDFANYDALLCAASYPSENSCDPASVDFDPIACYATTTSSPATGEVPIDDYIWLLVAAGGWLMYQFSKKV